MRSVSYTHLTLPTICSVYRLYRLCNVYRLYRLYRLYSLWDRSIITQFCASMGSV